MNDMPPCPPPSPQFLSMVPGRAYRSGGTYKFHNTLGQAKQAFSTYGRNYGTIWEWDPNSESWVELYTIAPGTKKKDLPWNIEKTAREQAKAELAAHKERERIVREVIKGLEGL